MKIVYFLFNIILFGILFYLVYAYWFKKKKAPKRLPQKPLRSEQVARGVGVDVMAEGHGKSAVPGKKVRVHYTAYLEDGTKVDSSYDKGEVFAFKLGNREVIPGWEHGMMGMKEGEKRRFTIAPEQAYGPEGKANVPPNATIVFEVELIKVI